MVEFLFKSFTLQETITILSGVYPLLLSILSIDGELCVGFPIPGFNGIPNTGHTDGILMSLSVIVCFNPFLRALSLLASSKNISGFDKCLIALNSLLRFKRMSLFLSFLCFISS